MERKRRNPALTGIEVRQDPSGEPRYRGQVWDKRKKRPRKGPWVRSAAEARSWRIDALRASEAAPDSPTLDGAARDFLAGVERGHIRNRSGDPYKPSTAWSYRQQLRSQILPRFGGLRLNDLRREDLQLWVERALNDGLSPSSVRNALNPVRAIYRWAGGLGLAAADPTKGLQLPAVRGRRTRIADPDLAGRLLDALPEGDRPIWAFAFYSGLRRGELLALRWAAVNLERCLVTVDPERGSYDPRTRQFAGPKSRAGARVLPIIARLRPFVPEPGEPEAFVFGMPDLDALARRATRAWEAAELPRFTLHDGRHTFASYLIASGLNAKAVTVLMGHSSITTTFDRYGHLFPGSEDEARDLLDAYLAQ